MMKTGRHFNIVERIATRLKLKQLRLLVAIAENASILHAATSLNISQPAATKLLKDLEEDFGVKLFERSNRGAIPTKYGEALTRHGKLILSQISQAAQELDDLAEGTGGRVVVGTLLAASAHLLPAAVEMLRKERPNVSIVIKEGTNDLLIPALLTGDIDIVVGRLPEIRFRKDVLQEPLFEEQVSIIARKEHPLTQMHKIRHADLLDWDWILPPRETTMRRQLEEEFLKMELSPPVDGVESVSLLTNKRIISRTDMLTVLPYHVIAEDVERGTLVSLPFKFKTVRGPVGISYRRNATLSPAAAAFADKLREIALLIQQETI
ncbi:LysR substrate-binding domain-containing protein [Sneathiella sp.]|jgi:DNA-binding transcriptional LysR family regulator|uniref:LysR substrate-binding domain-containing protein n=1 Tax=Sneathiella sp. TaxID=1964365 RepID=UPI0039E67CB8